MKLSYMVASSDIKNPDVLGYRGSLKKSLRTLASYGYDGVELMVVEPAKIDKEVLREQLNKFDLELVVVCTGELYGQEGLSFADPDPEIRKKAMKKAKEVARLGAEFGASINVGRLRGTYQENFPREETEKLALDGLRELTEYADELGIDVLLEPLNHLVATLATSTAEGLNWLEKVNQENIYLMLDLFHMNLEDESVESGFVRARGKFKHVHICDSNRKYPGYGHINFRSVLSILKNLDYEGYLSGEIIQYPDQQTALERTEENVKRFLAEINY